RSQSDKIDVTRELNVHGLGDFTASQVGANTVLGFGVGDSLTLQNITASTLQASDFNFNTLIESAGATAAVLANSNFFFSTSGSSTGPALTYLGSAVVGSLSGTQFGGWVPIAAEPGGGGYQVEWKFATADQYQTWNVSSTGAYLSTTSPVSGSDFGLQL